MSLRPRQVDFDSVWLGIRETSLGVITLTPVDRATWNDRFADVYYLCVAYPEPQASRLYAELKTFLRDHVRCVHEQVESGTAEGEHRLLGCYHRAWQVFSQGAVYLDSLFIYLNNQHLRKKKMSLAELIYGSVEVEGESACVLEVRELALALWRLHVIEPCQHRLVAQLLAQIELRRCGDCQGGGAVMREVIQSLVDVEAYRVRPLLLYESVFEAAYITATGQYFRQRAVALNQQLDVLQYMERVLRTVAEERQRCASFLPPGTSSVDRTMREVRARLVEDHLSWMLAEAPGLVRGERRAALTHLYQLLRPLTTPEPLQQVARALEQHVREGGVRAVEAAGRGVAAQQQPAAFVQAVLAVYSRYHRLVSDVFSTDQLFVSALSRACTSVVNHRGLQPAGPQAGCVPELLCRYVDQLLRRVVKTGSDSTLDARLADAVTVFKFVEDKDQFQKHYQKLLCKRLMYDCAGVAGIDAEELMVAKLKQACGYDFTNRLSQMLRDVGVSQQLSGQFAAFLEERRERLEHGVAVKVLQSGAWPVSAAAVVNFSVPRQLVSCVHHFDAFYGGKFGGRRLTWLHHLSSLELRLLYLSRLHLVTLHTFSGSILLLFDSTDNLSRADISAATALPADHLARNLHALVDAQLLVRHFPCPYDKRDSLRTGTEATESGNEEANTGAVTGTGAIAETGTNVDTGTGACGGRGTHVGTGDGFIDADSSGGGGDACSDEDTVYSLNMQFTCRRTRFRVQTAALAREPAVDAEVIRREVDECRKMCVQAAIVRIMKARKRQRHAELLNEVIAQTCSLFVPQVGMIKKCIDTLIDKDYVARVPNSPDEYSYVA